MRLLIFLALVCSTQLLFAQYENPVFLNPGDDVQGIMNGHPSNTLYIFKEGTHRMQRIIPKANDILIGEPGAVLNGSMILNNWVQEGNYWTHVIDQSTNPLVTISNFNCLQEYPQPSSGPTISYQGCKWYNRMFRNGKPLWNKPHLTELNNLPDTLGGSVPIVMEPFYGDCYYDIENSKIYLPFDPSNDLMEITVQIVGADYAIWSSNVGADSVLIKGLVIEQYSNTWGAITCNDSDHEILWTIENNLIQYNYARGLAFSGKSNCLIRSNKLNDNAQLGVLGSAQANAQGYFTLIDNNEFARNNYAGFNPSWEAGANKFFRTNGLVVRNNHSHHNNGPGFWTDIDNFNTLYEGNLIEDNRGVGLFHEVSFDAILRCNRLYNNNKSKNKPVGTTDFTQALYVSNSSNVLVENNYVRQDTAGRGIIVIQADRGSSPTYGPYCTDNIDIIDNDVVYSYSTPIHIAGSVISPSSIDSCGIPSHQFYDYNRYHLQSYNPIAQYFIHFGDTSFHSVRSFNQMQTLGYELNGSADDNIIDAPDYPECADIPKQILVKAKILLSCLLEDGSTEMTLPNPADRVHFQPFSGEPWNYKGQDVCPKFYDNMVDWVLLEIRDADDPNIILQQKAAILLKDGNIIDAYPSLQGVAQPGDILDGVAFYDLLPSLEYVLSVKTRQETMALANHSTLLTSNTPYDFTNPNEVENLDDFENIMTDIIALESINVTALASATDICIGESVELAASPNLIFNSEPTLVFDWNNGFSNEDSLTVSPTETTTYIVELMDQFGCSTLDEVEITVHQAPSAATISGATEVLVGSEELYQISNPDLASNFEWSVSGGTILDDMNNNITIVWDGMPPFELCTTETSEFGCEGEPSCLSIDIVTGTNDLSLARNLILYPNPTSDLFFIQSTSDIQVQEVTIYDGIGKEMLIQRNQEVNLSVFPDGVFWTKIRTDKGLIYKRIAKIK